MLVKMPTSHSRHQYLHQLQAPWLPTVSSLLTAYSGRQQVMTQAFDPCRLKGQEFALSVSFYSNHNNNKKSRSP